MSESVTQRQRERERDEDPRASYSFIRAVCLWITLNPKP